MTLIQAVKALKGVPREHLDWNGARFTFLPQFFLALFKVKTVNLAQLATALSGRAKVDANYKRLQRFFCGFDLEQATITPGHTPVAHGRGELIPDAGPHPLGI